MTKPILCLDFDGVIHSYTSGWQGAEVVADPPVPGALAFLVAATAHFDVCVYSSRSGQFGGVYAMQEWLKKHYATVDDADPVFINEFVCFKLKWPQTKPPAKITIDDRALTFTGEWPDMGTLLNFKPWNAEMKT